jgi:two-component sensor histidine kinase
MPKGSAPAKAGLGASLVEALAGQLGARVRLADADPGTVVSIVRDARERPSDTGTANRA